MLNVAIIVVIAASSVWVYLDATNYKIGKIPDRTGMFNLSAGHWGTVTLLLWIIGFPAYLIKRNSLIEIAKEHPIDVKGRAVKSVVFATFGSLWAFMSFVSVAMTILPTCSDASVKSLVGQILTEMSSAKRAGAKFVSVEDEAELGFNQTTQIRTCTGTTVTTIGEDLTLYSIMWRNQDRGEYEVEAQRQ